MPAGPSAMRCTLRYGSPSRGTSVANSSCSPRGDEMPLPVTARQNAVPASNVRAGRSRKAVIHRSSAIPLSLGWSTLP